MSYCIGLIEIGDKERRGAAYGEGLEGIAGTSPALYSDEGVGNFGGRTKLRILENFKHNR